MAGKTVQEFCGCLFSIQSNQLGLRIRLRRGLDRGAAGLKQLFSIRAARVGGKEPKQNVDPEDYGTGATQK